MKTFPISNEQVLLSAAALDAQLRDNTAKFPGLFSLKLSRIHKALVKERDVILEQRQKLLDAYTKFEGEGDDKKPVPFKNDKGEVMPDIVSLTDPKEFNAKEKELLKGSVDVNVPAITEGELKDLDISAALATAILPFVEG